MVLFLSAINEVVRMRVDSSESGNTELEVAIPQVAEPKLYALGIPLKSIAIVSPELLTARPCNTAIFKSGLSS